MAAKKLKKPIKKKPKKPKKPGKPKGSKPNPDDVGKIKGKKPQKPITPKKPVAALTVSGTGRLTNVFHAVGPFNQTNEFDLTIRNVSQANAAIQGCDLLMTQAGGWIEGMFNLYARGRPLAGEPTALAPNGSIKVKFDWGTGNGVTHGVIRLRGPKQHSLTPIAIVRDGFPAPPPVSADRRLFIGLYTQPGEVIPLWKDGIQTVWLTVGGMLFNLGAPVRVSSVKIVVNSDGQTIFSSPVVPNFRDYNYDDYTLGEAALPLDADGTVLLTAIASPFVHGLEIPDFSADSSASNLRVEISYTGGSGNASTSVQIPLRFIDPRTFLSPVKGTWLWGSAGDHSNFDAHTWPHQRFSVDLVRLVNGSTLKPSANTAMPNNEDFYAYGEPVFAVAGGSVVDADDDNPESNGYTPLKNGKVNYICIESRAGITGYYHLRQGANLVQVGDTVEAGQQIAQVGNSATAEPHLHFGFISLDETGRGRLRPMQFSNLESLDAQTVVGVPASGEYTS